MSGPPRSAWALHRRDLVSLVTKRYVDLIPRAIHCGCMGLPQELVDHIMEMLDGDFQALKACSLVCKAMFASTRHLIHETLCLTQRNDNSVLTREERKKLRYQYQRSGGHGVTLRFLSYVGERGFLQYTRRVHIRESTVFTPETLQPHLHHFRSLDRVHTLILEKFDILSWTDHYKTHFVHFYPTLTSLTLTRPASCYRAIMQFVLQFPNLESLCLEWLKDEVQLHQGSTSSVVVVQFPPLHGHLRLAFGTWGRWLADFIRDFQSRTNFRSVELEPDSFGNPVQSVLNVCAHTLESLIIVSPANATHNRSIRLEFTQMAALRRVTFRVPFHQAITTERTFLPGLLSTITSPFFCEFALELDQPPFRFDSPSLEDWSRWVDTDKFLENRFAKRGDFKFIIKTSGRHNRETFQRNARMGFPLLVKRKCVHFEIPYG